ncbi:hypothetical protein F4553_001368 [Allocatelliglobosispora scoriae]|uniref:Uncharacterized protein n=1 Tax=Allocatelliglobosispora scoriae TaxID=643052 RepID=A0A841BLB3_9ACTN|nr:hypothetical protein [Allocatelliglobosispora scoriae]MBB5867989.1 hypothetical protein [Allocatelliglobosispora scoriae]
MSQDPVRLGSGAGRLPPDAARVLSVALVTRLVAVAERFDVPLRSLVLAAFCSSWAQVTGVTDVETGLIRDRPGMTEVLAIRVATAGLGWQRLAVELHETELDAKPAGHEQPVTVGFAGQFTPDAPDGLPVLVEFHRRPVGGELAVEIRVSPPVDREIAVTLAEAVETALRTVSHLGG